MATRKDAKEETTTTSPTQLQREQQQAVYKTLDETRDEIRKSVNEARKEIPRVTEAISEYQQQTIEAAREIADNYIESQKEIINSVQSAWSPLLENFNRTNWNSVFSPGRVSEIYANIVSSYAENLVTATKLANNVMFANMETFRTSIQQVKDIRAHREHADDRRQDRDRRALLRAVAQAHAAGASGNRPCPLADRERAALAARRLVREDAARNRNDNGPANIAILRRRALDTARLDQSKGSLTTKLKRAGWDDEFMLKLLSHMR